MGREKEINEISRHLTEPGCSLLTLVGPGGIGKTRLALRVGHKMVEHFAHGVFFVPLQAVQAADFLASTIIDALNLPLRGQQAQPALLNYLQDKELLLMLDNFEQLLPEGGAMLVTNILAAAPQVKLLITSREVLNLQEEWLYPVQGMPYPTADTQQEVEAYEAVQLFVERARRVRRDFTLDDELEDVTRICRLVEGMPLAIELAASWTKTLPCAAIATEIQRNLNFLTSSLRNVPERQRSMQAVFAQSWQLLTPQERNVFKRLSVFRGHFHREAAKQVAGASLETLTALVDKSLLRLEPDGRYQIHELLRQCAAEHLVRSPEDVAQVYDLHCTYYANFLQQWKKDITGGNQQAAVKEIAANLDNVRAAWQWAIQQIKVEEIAKAASTLQYFFQIQARYAEAIDGFEKAVQALDAAQPAGEQKIILGEVLVYLGWFYLRLGQLKKAKAVLERSRAVYQSLNIAHPVGSTNDPLTALGTLANILGHYQEAEKLGAESRQINESLADKGNLMDSFYVLTNAAFGQGKFEAAQQYARQACALAEEINDRWMMTHILSDLGNIARALGDYNQATQHYQASYAIQQEYNYPGGMASCLNQLGRVAILQKNYTKAQDLYRQGLALFKEVGDRGGLAESYNGLGMAACALGNYREARQNFRQALQITLDIDFVSLMLDIIIGLADLLLQTGRPERGTELLGLVLHHPATGHETKERANRCLSRHKSNVDPELLGNATQQGQPGNLQTVAASLLAELATLPGELAAAENLPTPSGEPISANDALVEPLTPRELEVLQLVAGGLTNQQIATELVISVGTAKWYTGQIYGKLGVANRTQAVARARELNLLP